MLFAQSWFSKVYSQRNGLPALSNYSKYLKCKEPEILLTPSGKWDWTKLCCHSYILSSTELVHLKLAQLPHSEQYCWQQYRCILKQCRISVTTLIKMGMKKNSNTGCYLYYYMHFVIKLSNTSAEAENLEAVYLNSWGRNGGKKKKKPHLSAPTIGS